MNFYKNPNEIHATTILCVRKGNDVVMCGDGQASMGTTIAKTRTKKVRKLEKHGVLTGFAGSAADGFALIERLEGKLEKHPMQLMRACVELAKDWRCDRVLRKLEAMLIVANSKEMLTIIGNGDVLEPEQGICAIGSGGLYALSAGLALYENTEFTALEIATRAMKIAGDICIYTNHNLTIESLSIS